MTTMTTPLVPVENEAPSDLFSPVDDMGMGERIKHYKAMQMPFKGADIDTVNLMANFEPGSSAANLLEIYVIVLGATACRTKSSCRYCVMVSTFRTSPPKPPDAIK
jgi:hypothetical protein